MTLSGVTKISANVNYFIANSCFSSKNPKYFGTGCCLFYVL